MPLNSLAVITDKNKMENEKINSRLWLNFCTVSFKMTDNKKVQWSVQCPPPPVQFATRILARSLHLFFHHVLTGTYIHRPDYMISHVWAFLGSGIDSQKF